MIKYSSTDTYNFRNRFPESGHPNDASGWKTFWGSINEAKKLSYCLIFNSQFYCELKFHIRLSFRQNISEDDHKLYWKQISRKLKNSNVIAFWIRELDKNGLIHYHLAIASEHDSNSLIETIKSSIPSEITKCSEVHCERIKSQRGFANYITKKRMSGYDHDGKFQLKDRYKSKRRIFSKECKLSKLGTIGEFWMKPRKEIWKDHADRERFIWSLSDIENEAISNRVAKLLNMQYKTVHRNFFLESEYRKFQYEKTKSIREFMLPMTRKDTQQYNGNGDAETELQLNRLRLQAKRRAQFLALEFEETETETQPQPQPQTEIETQTQIEEQTKMIDFSYLQKQQEVEKKRREAKAYIQSEITIALNAHDTQHVWYWRSVHSFIEKGISLNLAMQISKDKFGNTISDSEKYTDEQINLSEFLAETYALENDRFEWILIPQPDNNEQWKIGRRKRSNIHECVWIPGIFSKEMGRAEIKKQLAKSKSNQIKIQIDSVMD